jgi:acetyltransferase-like isoleucine patch superfamily enzyme
MDGAQIGKGAVIGAGSVVTGDIPDYSIAISVPARVAKSRRDSVLRPALEQQNVAE